MQQINSKELIIELLEGTQGLGVVLAETKNAAESVIEAFNGLKVRVIVQEFVKEANGADIRVFVVDGLVVGAMKRQGKKGEFRSNLHRGVSTEAIVLSKNSEFITLEATKHIGLAVARIDLIRSKKGPLLIEVNASPGPATNRKGRLGECCQGNSAVCRMKRQKAKIWVVASHRPFKFFYTDKNRITISVVMKLVQ